MTKEGIVPSSTQISGFNVAARNYQKLVEAVMNLGGGDEAMNLIFSDAELRHKLAELLVGQAGSTADPGTVIGQLILTVDYGFSVEDKVVGGHYDGYVNPAITSVNFPHQREGVEKVTLSFVKFARAGTTEERERALLVHGDPTDMHDMLATGIKYPDEQRKYPLVFLGASWVHPDGSRRVGCLGGDGDVRGCYLDWTSPQDEWYPGYVFAVRARK